LAALRASKEESLAEFARRLGISRHALGDIEHGRRGISVARAADWSIRLGDHHGMLVQLVMQDQLHDAGLCLRVELHAR
jgi:transcriptional regulator with XRE-family HTH domain